MDLLQTPFKNCFYDAKRKMKENKLTRNIKVRDHQFKQIYDTSWSSVVQWLVIERSLLCQIGLALFSRERWLRYER
jgi:acetone carboxylase gamma subunit